MVINKKLMRGTRSVKLRLLGVLAITLFSTALMISFSLAMKSVSARLEEFRREHALHDIRMETVTPIDVNALPDGAEAEMRYFLDADLSDGRLLHITSLTEKNDTVCVTEGEAVNERGELLLDRMFAESNGISIGDKIDVLGKSFVVCGFYTSPDTLLPAKTADSIMISSDSFGLAAMSENDIKTLGECETEYLIRLENVDNDSMNRLIDKLHSEYIVTELKKAEEDNRATYINGDLKLFSEDFLILPAIFIVTAALSCAAVISRIMKAEATQIGVLYALGYKRKTLYLHYMLYPLAVSLGGAALGIAAGIGAAPLIAGILKSRYLLPPFEMRIYPDVLIKSAALPFIFMTVICSASIILMLTHTPLELIRNEKNSPRMYGAAHFRLKGLPFGARFSLRSLIRNLPRELFLIGGIALSSILMLTYVSMISSLSEVLNESFDKILKYEYMYTFSVPQSEPHEEVCRINMISVLLDGDYIDLSGTSDEYSMMNYTNTDGSKTDFGQNIITNNMARKYGISEGDTVTLTNSLNDEIYEIRIDKICVSYVENFISVPLERFNEMTRQPQGSYVILASDSRLEIKDKSALISEDTLEANRTAIRETLLPLYILVAVLIAMGAVVALIINVIVTSVIIEESGHTISLMKVFGYEERRIARLVIDGNAVAAALGLFLSIPLAVGISERVFDFMSDTLGMYIPAQLDTLYCIIGFIAVMLIFLASKTITQRRIFAADAAVAVKAKE